MWEMFTPKPCKKIIFCFQYSSISIKQPDQPITNVRPCFGPWDVWWNRSNSQWSVIMNPAFIAGDWSESMEQNEGKETSYEIYYSNDISQTNTINPAVFYWIPAAVCGWRAFQTDAFTDTTEQKQFITSESKIIGRSNNKDCKQTSLNISTVCLHQQKCVKQTFVCILHRDFCQ